ncbi:MFS transporter [Candidatus Parcubacteria bacterium]|nr:MFS transporter [Candidatus Parcubacteria bacterium]
MEFTLPRIQKITKYATVSHFLLMFGYKFFSLFFPLFLIAKGFSLPEVGYAYLLLYVPIALFSPVVGFLNHKINPAILAAAGILGYGAYSLGMIFIQEQYLFYFLQILLGISAAFFMVSFRAILIGLPLENYNRSFGWFYSAPSYAAVLAPLIGAVIIWQFGFVGVFTVSLFFHLFNAVFCFTYLRKPSASLVDNGFSFLQFMGNYQKSIFKIFKKAILPFVLISFSTLFLAGFYRAFFLLFLKDIGWEQNQVILFCSLLPLVFLPVSLLIIKRLKKREGNSNIIKGGLIVAVFSILFGLFGMVLNALVFFKISIITAAVILALMIGKSIGDFIANSGRSSLLSRKLKEYPEEAGAIDTIFAPLGAGIGSLVAGLAIGFLDFSLLFILGGAIVLATVMLGKRLIKI